MDITTILYTLGAGVIAYLVKEIQDLKKENKVLKGYLFKTLLAIKSLDDETQGKTPTQLADEIIQEIGSVVFDKNLK